MPKFDHRLKRLENKANIEKHIFDYWVIFVHDKTDESLVEKKVREIKAGNVVGKYRGSKYDPENPKHMIIVSGVLRPSERALQEKKKSPSKEIPFSQKKDVSDLTDAELEAEISSIEKELEK